jgi:hypothetical protein
VGPASHIFSNNHKRFLEALHDARERSDAHAPVGDRWALESGF